MCGGDPAPGVPKVLEARFSVGGGRIITRTCRLAGDARLAEPLSVSAEDWRQDRDATGTEDRAASRRIHVVAASVGDPASPAGAADVTGVVQAHVDGHGSGFRLEIGRAAPWLPDPLPGRPKQLRVRYRCWARDLEVCAGVEAGSGAALAPVSMGAAAESRAGEGAATPSSGDGAAARSSAAGRPPGSTVLRSAPLTGRFPVYAGHDEGGDGAAGSAAHGDSARAGDGDGGAGGIVLTSPLRVLSPRLRPRLRVVSASWGHPTQPSGAYDVTHRVASMAFELCGADPEPPAHGSVRCVPHPADEDIVRSADPASAADSSWSAGLKGAWVAGGAGWEPRADWLSIAPSTDLHSVLGDPFRTLGKVLSIAFRLAPRPAASRAVLRQGRLLQPVTLRSPVVGPALQVASAIMQPASPSALPVDVSAPLKELLEIQGGFQLRVGGADDALALLGLGPGATLPGECTAPAKPVAAGVRPAGTEEQRPDALRPTPAATASARPEQHRRGMLRMRATPLGDSGRAATTTSARARSAAQQAPLALAPADPIAPRFASGFGGAATSAVAANGYYRSKVDDSALPLSFGRTGAMQETARLVASKPWGDDGLRALGTIDADGEEGAVARRLMGAGGGGRGKWHTLKLELFSGMRRLRASRAIAAGSKSFSGASLRRLLPDGVESGPLSVISDFAIGTGADPALLIHRATITPEDGAADLRARLANEQRATASDLGSSALAPGFGASNARPPARPPTVVDVSQALRAACRMTRDGLQLHLPTGIDLTRCIGPVPFEGRDRAIEVHWTTPNVVGTIRVANIVPGPLGCHIRLGWAPPAERVRSMKMAQSVIPGCLGTSAVIARAGPDREGAVFLPLAAQSVMADGIGNIE